MNTTPSVTVLMPVYNGERFLKEAIDSILTQTYNDFELIIVDDGSTDNTSNIVHSYKDIRIKYEKNETNIKIIRTLNKGLSLSKGRYIVRMDADDIALPNRLELQVAYMEANPDVVLCGSSLNRFSDTYSITDLRGGDDTITRAKLLFDTAINHPSAIIRNYILKKYHLEYPSDFLHTEDYAFWYTLSQYGKVVNLDEVLVRYRMHGNNLSMQHNRLQYQNMNHMRLLIMNDFLKSSTAHDSEIIMKKYQNLLFLEKVTINDMKVLDELLMRVVDINQVSHIYNDIGLKRAAAWFWYVVFTHENCRNYNWKMISLFLWNKHSLCKYLDKQHRKKFLIKSLLLWKKK